MSRHPAIKWAQRSDRVYLTIDLPDAKDVKMKLEPEGKLAFSASKDGIPYELDIDFFDRINVEESKATVGVRSIAYVIAKAEKKWWSRLLKQEGKPPAFVKVDWDRWVDEDDENEKKGLGSEDMDFSKRSKQKKKKKTKKEQSLVQKLMGRLKPGCVCLN